jgi:hypothetical protein
MRNYLNYRILVHYLNAILHENEGLQLGSIPHFRCKDTTFV